MEAEDKDVPTVPLRSPTNFVQDVADAFFGMQGVFAQLGSVEDGTSTASGYDAIDALCEEHEKAIGRERSQQFAQMAMEADVPRSTTGSAHEDVDAERQALRDEVESRKHAEWMSIFGIRVLPARPRKPEPDLLLEAAQSIADGCLRDHVTMPVDPENPEVSLRDAGGGGGAAACVPWWASRVPRWKVYGGFTRHALKTKQRKLTKEN